MSELKSYAPYSITDEANGFAGTDWANKIFSGEADEFRITNPLAKRQYGQPLYHVFHKCNGKRMSNGCSVFSAKTMAEAISFCHARFELEAA